MDASRLGREEFEAWASQNEVSLRLSPDGSDYDDPGTRACWAAWWHLTNRAALASPEPAQAPAPACPESIIAACASVPALEEARRRRLRWADEAYKQILDVPVPAQPAQAGEAVVWDDLNMCDEETLRSCVDIIDRVPTDNGGISPTLGAVARTALYYLKRASATPRAEARAERALGLLREARECMEGGGCRDGDCAVIDRICALLKEVSHGQQG